MTQDVEISMTPNVTGLAFEVPARRATDTAKAAWALLEAGCASGPPRSPHHMRINGPSLTLINAH